MTSIYYPIVLPTSPSPIVLDFRYFFFLLSFRKNRAMGRRREIKRGGLPCFAIVYPVVLSFLMLLEMIGMEQKLLIQTVCVYIN